MDMMELIRTRKSVRTFDGNAVTENDIKKLTEYRNDHKPVWCPCGICSA